ncbi:unnamed protein product [Urochloa decumbens]|uniref:KIB1-4 beta-propeller domain-containing protein n=1 Tax=Urochloa decumbens TaxID=240449 RepID=A0ABC9BAP7_9POAL
MRFAMKRPRICRAGGSGWPSLHVDLLEQISGHLSTEADHLHIHQVCAHWRASTSPPAAFRPWILTHWMAVASQRQGNMCAQKPFFWRPGDAAWSVLCDRPTAGIDCVAFHGGRMYYLDCMRLLVVCDLNPGPAQAPFRITNTSGVMNRLCSCDPFHGVRGAHMVSCAGDLLLVVLREGSGHPSFAEIYKLEKPPESGRPLELGDRVRDLGEHSLFLSRGESFTLSAKGFPAIKRNHVYGLSVGHCPDMSSWAFVFDLGSDTLKEIPYPQELRDDGGNWWSCFWLCLKGPFMKKQQHLVEEPATLSSADGVP